MDIKEKIKNYPLEIRIFILTCLSGLIFSLISATVNILLNLGLGIILACFGAGIICLIMLYFVIHKNSYKLPVNLGILSLIFVIVPIMWKFNSGSHGPISFFIFFTAIYCSIYTDYLNWKLTLILQLIVFVLLLLTEYIYPNQITTYIDSKTRLLDIGTGFSIMFIAIFVFLRKILNEYNKTIKELRETKLELTEINNKLKVVSEKDELTGVYNRKFIIETLNKLTFLKDYSSITLVLIDIDHFNKINDLYGHIVGDKVIKDTANILKQNLRSNDYIGRTGGEEFLMIFPNTHNELVTKKINKIKECVENYKWIYLKSTVTISCGIYTGDSNENFDSLLENVEKLLYNSKNSGRNRVTSISKV